MKGKRLIISLLFSFRPFLLVVYIARILERAIKHNKGDGVFMYDNFAKQSYLAKYVYEPQVQQFLLDQYNYETKQSKGKKHWDLRGPDGTLFEVKTFSDSSVKEYKMLTFEVSGLAEKYGWPFNTEADYYIPTIRNSNHKIIRWDIIDWRKFKPYLMRCIEKTIGADYLDKIARGQLESIDTADFRVRGQKNKGGVKWLFFFKNAFNADLRLVRDDIRQYVTHIFPNKKLLN